MNHIINDFGGWAKPHWHDLSGDQSMELVPLTYARRGQMALIYCSQRAGGW